MNAKLVLTIAAAATLLASCGRKELEDGGVYITRNTCPQVGVPAGTGDMTLFNPPSSNDAGAIDVSATITNVRATCTETADQLISSATFDVVAVRRDAGPARTVVFPYYDVAMQGGNQVVAKRVGQVALNFAAGQVRASTNGQATIRVSRAATSLPEDVRAILTAPRKAGDESAAVDPMTIPSVRAAVLRATFEHLIGFHLTDEQLRYNATR